MSDPEFDRWFEDDLPQRKATEGLQVRVLATASTSTAWCVAYEFTPAHGHLQAV